MMKHCKLPQILTVLTVITLLVCSCSNRKSASLADFTKEIYAPEHASGFKILGAPGRESTLITVSNPWQGADSVRTMLFVARGDEAAPEGDDVQVLRGDARRIVAMSSTHVAMLNAVGAADCLVGVSGIDFISNEYVQAHRDTIGDVGYEGNVNYEKLVSLAPDLVLLYGINGASSMEGKLKELEIPYLYIGDYLEQSPLGKAEWLVALAEVTGRRAVGEERISEISRRYDALKQLVAGKTDGASSPKVMFNMPYGDAWFMPSAGSYMVRLLNDAGGEYVYAAHSGNASETIDLEKAYLLTSQADVWINVGQASTLKEVEEGCPKFVDTPCFKSGSVYNNNRRTTPSGGNDYYESAVVNPDLLLRDLIKIFHPELVDDDFVYYQQLK